MANPTLRQRIFDGLDDDVLSDIASLKGSDDPFTRGRETGLHAARVSIMAKLHAKLSALAIPDGLEPPIICDMQQGFIPKRVCEGAPTVDGKCARCQIDGATRASINDPRCLSFKDGPEPSAVRLVTDPESACNNCTTLTHCKHVGRCLAECEPSDLVRPEPLSASEWRYAAFALEKRAEVVHDTSITDLAAKCRAHAEAQKEPRPDPQHYSQMFGLSENIIITPREPR